VLAGDGRGIIKPTKGSGSLVELIKMLPDGFGVIPRVNNVRHGKIEEFQSAIPAYEEKIAVPLKALIRRQAPMISSQEWKC
jgi:hypothetical protein